MANKISYDDAKVCAEAVIANGGIRAAARALGMPYATVQKRNARWHSEFTDAGSAENSPTEVMKLQVKIKELNAKLRETVKGQLLDETVKDFILHSRADTAEIPEWLPVEREADDGGQVLCAQWSDFHWAEVVDPTQTMGLNEYNMEIAAKRLKTLCANTVYMANRHLRKRDWPGIIINLNGDMVSGDIHEELTETNAAPMMPAFLDLKRNMVKALTYMADEFGKVFVPCEFGNHARTNKKPQSKNAAYKNFDWLLYHELADLLADDNRIRFLIGDGPDLEYKVYGHRYRLMHGNQFRGGTGFVGAMAPITTGELKKRLAASSQGLPYDTLIMGHFHQTMWRPHIIVNGSLVGYNEYAMQGNFGYDAPKQMLWLTNARFGPVSPMEIWCEEPKGDQGNTDWVSWKD